MINITRYNILLLLILISSLIILVSSFDTGHHADLTRNAMEHFQYSENASSAVFLFNWFTDYFSFNVEISGDLLPQLRMMHFANVHFLPYPAMYWNQLIINTERAIQSVAKDNDVMGYLVLLGVSLHTVQDFYSHSNWVELNPRTSCDCYSTRTWIQTWNNILNDVFQIKNLMSLRTYSYGECDSSERNCAAGFLDHGDYCGGINKDSYVRPLWESAHSHAFAGTLEWIANVERWTNEINPDLLRRVKEWQPSSETSLEQLREDIESARIISYSIEFFGEDGHWKGAGSGDLERFGTESVDFLNRDSVYKQIFEDDRLWEPLTTPNLIDAPESFMLMNETNSTLFNLISIDDILKDESPANDSMVLQAIVVRTIRVEGEDSFFNTPSFYARIVIDGQEYIETPQSDDAEFSPYWTSIKYVPIDLEQVSIGYTLMIDNFPDDDEILPFDSSSDPHLNLTLNLFNNSISGDRFGVYDSPTNALSVSFLQNGIEFNNNNSNYNDNKKNNKKKK